MKVMLSRRNQRQGRPVPWVVLIACLSAFAASQPAVNSAGAAQGGAPVSQGEDWRRKPPELPPPRPFNAPKVTAYKLDNGLSVQLVEDHRVPFVTAFLGIKAGSSLEPVQLTGLASMTAGMLTEGTKNRTSKQIADEIDFIGGGLHGGSDYDFTTISGSVLSKYTDRFFNLLSEVVLTPSFPESELKLKKDNLLQELKMKRSEPDFLTDERFAKVLFGAHPYSVVAPTPEAVERMTVGDLRAYHEKHFLPGDAYLVVVGDFDEKAMKALVDKSFGQTWKAGKMPVAQPAKVPSYSGRRIYLVDRPGSVQSAVKIGNVGIKRSDPDYFPFLVCNQVLGGASQARLFLNIREQKGYTYGAYSGFAARKQPGAFAAEADVRTDVTSPSVQEFLYELDRIRNVKATDKELNDAKRFLAGSFQLGLETQAGLAQRLLEQRLYDLPADYLETYANKVMAVSVDDVRRVARKNIDYDGLAIVVVGDAAKIKSDLEFFAPVQVFSTSGKAAGGSAQAQPDKGS